MRERVRAAKGFTCERVTGGKRNHRSAWDKCNEQQVETKKYSNHARLIAPGLFHKLGNERLHMSTAAKSVFSSWKKEKREECNPWRRNSEISFTGPDSSYPDRRVIPVIASNRVVHMHVCPLCTGLTLFTWTRCSLHHARSPRTYSFIDARYASRGVNRSENKEIPSEIFVILNNIASPLLSVDFKGIERVGRVGVIVGLWKVPWTGSRDKGFCGVFKGGQPAWRVPTVRGTERGKSWVGKWSCSIFIYSERLHILC